MSIYKIDSLSALNDFSRLSTHERAKLTTLTIESTPRWSLHVDVATQFKILPESLSQCKQLQTVVLYDSFFLSNPDLFIALGNAIAESKHIQIDLGLYNIGAIDDNLKNALSTWPIKRLSLARNSRILTPNFWLVIANLPIQSIDFSNCIFTVDNYNALQMFLTQSETVSVLDVSHHILPTIGRDYKAKLHALLNALAAGKLLQRLYLDENSLADLDPEDFEKFCGVLIQLKELQFISLSKNEFYNSKRFKVLCRDVLSQLPNLQAMNLQQSPYWQHPSTRPLAPYDNVSKGLAYLTMLSNITIGAPGQFPQDMQVQAFQKSFDPIREKNRDRYLAPFITVSSILHQLGCNKETRLAILKQVFSRHYAKLAESVDNSISNVFERRKQRMLTLEEFTALSPERCAVLNTFNVTTQSIGKGCVEINNLSQQLSSPDETGNQIIRQLHDNLLRCDVLHTFSLNEELSTSQVDGLIALGKICAAQPLLKTFEIIYSRHSWDTYGFNKEMVQKLTSSLEKLQNEFKNIGFKTQKITSTQYSGDIMSGNSPRIDETPIAPQDIPSVLENRIISADRFSVYGATLTFKFARKCKAQVVAEEQPENRLRISNG